MLTEVEIRRKVKAILVLMMMMNELGAAKIGSRHFRTAQLIEFGAILLYIFSSFQFFFQPQDETIRQEKHEFAGFSPYRLVVGSKLYNIYLILNYISSNLIYL